MNSNEHKIVSGLRICRLVIFNQYFVFDSPPKSIYIKLFFEYTLLYNDARDCEQWSEERQNNVTVTNDPTFQETTTNNVCSFMDECMHAVL